MYGQIRSTNVVSLLEMLCEAGSSTRHDAIEWGKLVNTTYLACTLAPVRVSTVDTLLYDSCCQVSANFILFQKYVSELHTMRHNETMYAI
jgi:hypothetical protein